MPRSLSRFRLVMAVVSLAAAVVAAAPADALRTRVKEATPQSTTGGERGLYVSVVTSDGTPVTDLSERDFVVREDGVLREVLRVERATEPITIALLVDNSAASAPFIADARRALKTFAARMSAARNPVSVVTFADRPTIVQDYTLVPSQVTSAIERVFPVKGSGACLLEALKETSERLAKRAADRGLILAVTGEGPEFSDLYPTQVVPALRASGAAFHALVVNQPRRVDPGEQSVRNRGTVLDEGTRATGGRQVNLLSGLALEPALQRLADQLSAEFKVTYSRPGSLIPPEKIDVRVNRPGLDARGTPIGPTRG